MSALITAVAVVGVGAYVSAEGQKDAAKGQANAVRDASITEAQGYQDAGDIQKERQKDVQNSVAAQKQHFNNILANATSPEAMRALNNSISSQESSLQKQAALFDSIDPAVMEASQQALSLMQGEDARSLAPLREERKVQRQALTDRLREQLGPGAETSTAGMQALNEFDRQTGTQLNQAQQSSMGQLFGMAQNGAQNRGAMNQSNATLGQLGSQMGNLNTQGQQTSLNALAGMQNADGQLNAAANNVAQMRLGQAGAQAQGFMGAAIEAQGRGQAAATYGNALTNIGGMVAGAGGGSTGGGGGNQPAAGTGAPMNNNPKYGNMA